MAVPNTTNFTLQDVVDEINPTSDTLLQCFAQAQDSAFVTAYKGSKDRLSNFRGYNHNSGYSLTEYRLSYFGSSDSFKCSADLNPNISKYSYNSGEEHYINNIIFNGSTSTSSVFQGGNLWYRIALDASNPGVAWVYKINNSGVITDKVNCTP